MKTVIAAVLSTVFVCITFSVQKAFPPTTGGRLMIASNNLTAMVKGGGGK